MSNSSTPDVQSTSQASGKNTFNPFRTIKGLLTNRFVWTVLSILAELIILVLLYLVLYNSFFPITILAIILSLAVTLYIINYYQNLEMRLLWAFIVVSLPIIGPFLFLLFAGNRKNQPIRLKINAIRTKLASFYSADATQKTLQKLRSINQSAYLQANYLCQADHISLSEDNHIDYYPNGESCFKQLLRDLETAKQYIMLEFFIIRPGEMWQQILDLLRAKVAAGVDVYVMYDDIGSIFTLPSRYYRELEALGIHCIPSNKFSSRISGFHNNRDHRKIIVIDGKIGYTGGFNLADEYANIKSRYGYWKDAGLRLEGPAVTNLLTLFLSSWNLHSKTPISLDQYRPQTTKNTAQKATKDGFCLVYGSGPTPIYDQPVAKNAYLNLIYSATKSLYITTPYLVCDNEVMNALALAAEKGVDVRIITPHIPDKKIVYLMTRSNYLPLIKRGVKIYEYQPGFMHAKTILCDDECGICGTINLDFRSLIYHFECAAWMYQTPCLKDIASDFQTTLKSCKEITLETARLKWPLRTAAEILKVFTPLF